MGTGPLHLFTVVVVVVAVVVVVVVVVVAVVVVGVVGFAGRWQLRSKLFTPHRPTMS